MEQQWWEKAREPVQLNLNIPPPEDVPKPKKVRRSCGLVFGAISMNPHQERRERRGGREGAGRGTREKVGRLPRMYKSKNIEEERRGESRREGVTNLLRTDFEHRNI